eukprot:CCRYP_005284-RA/>CCRYP_005284-RA protein AED:0.32 eAED:0.32 QI:187/1/1/1/1/1/2/468/363
MNPGPKRRTMTAQSLEISSKRIPSPNTSPTTSQASIDDEYRAQREQAKLRHWKESEYAAGLVEPTWADELEIARQTGRCCCCCVSREALGQAFQEEIDPGCGCIYLSAVVCSRIGAGRIGNMAVLKERYVWVEAEEDESVIGGEDGHGGDMVCDGFVDEEQALHQRKSLSDDTNETVSKNNLTARRLVRRSEIQFVVGPFWPMLLFITYPLIFGVSIFTLCSALPGRPLPLQIVWGILTGQLIRSLFNTGFRDPGILKRHRDPPPVENDDLDDDDDILSRRRVAFRFKKESGPWRWSDHAQSYRPRNSMYDPDCKVVVEEFDHTCPWTGTAIGKKNMRSFQCFVTLVFICLIMDIFLLTGAVP